MSTITTTTTPKKRRDFDIRNLGNAGKKANKIMARKIRFSNGIKDRFSEAERKKLAAEFVRRFRKSGRQFIEKPLSDGDCLIFNVTKKLYQVMLESEW